MRRWHFLPVGMILIINTVGLTMIYRRIDKFLKLYPPNALEAVRLSTAEIADKLTSVQGQLTLLQLPENSSALGTTTSAPTGQLSDLLPDIPDASSTTSLRYISVSEGFTDSVRIYKEHADFSPVIGQLVPGQKYPFSGQLNNWYQINLSRGITGWVQAAHVHEIL